MNILYLTTHLNIGGISRYLLSLCSGIKQRGQGVYLASSGGDLGYKFIEQGIDVISIPIKTKSEVSPRLLLSLFKLLAYCRSNKIDIIHSNTRVTNVLACLLSRILHKPFISTCHGFFEKRLSRRIFPCWGKKVIAISQQVKVHLMNDFKVKEEDIRVIHNGIDIKKVRSQKSEVRSQKSEVRSWKLEAGSWKIEDRSQKKKKFGLREGRVVGIIARLSDVKGHIYLIRAMKKVFEDIPDAQLFIIGEGKMYSQLASLIKELNIGEETVIIPSVMDTQEALSVMDIFVMPSLNEGLGLGLIEAMAAGVAVIGSDVGGIKSLIQDNYNGLLVEPAHPEKLYLAIKDLLTNPQKRESLAANAKEHIVSNFSLSGMLLLTERVYQEVLTE